MGDTSRGSALGQWIAWWLALAGLWLLLVAKTTPDNLIAAAVTAAIAASVAQTLSRHGLFRPAFPAGGLAPLLRVPGQILRDTGVVAAALGRQLVGRQAVQGKMRDVPFDPGGDDLASAARRALVVLFVSLSPNTVAVSIDRQNNLLHVHQLVPSPEMPGHGDRKWPV